MKIILFHYHLNPGGVTRIIDSQIKAIKHALPEAQIRILTGSCSNKNTYTESGVSVEEFDVLNYLTSKENLDEKYLKITDFLKEYCSKDDILHFHNLNLGKNPLVTLIVSKMAAEGYLVINHAHDFSEDRPENQKFIREIIEMHFGENLKKIMYPQFDNYQFVAINSSDKNRIISYGINQKNCTLLANPVLFTKDLSDSKSERNETRHRICSILKIDAHKKIITYPVRVIRRKNIGEFILLAALFKHEANWVVTQPPKNPVEIPFYEDWKSFCFENNIPVIWDAGNKADFEELLIASDFCMTTSIREGFGMTFLEPWLMGIPVKGRNIPMVTTDLIEKGIEFPLLYDHFFIENTKELIEYDYIEQRKIISDITHSGKKQKSIFDLNPFLSHLLETVNDAWIKKNKEVILNQFSVEKYGNKLYELYRRIIKKSDSN